MKPTRLLCLILALTFVAAGLKSESESDSAQQPQSTKRVEKYIYKQTPQGELTMYVHFPKNWTADDKRSAIVFFFGGGWVSGTVEQFLPQAEYLAGRGMVTARTDYRVRDRHGTTPDKCIEDGKSAVRWLRANAATLGINPNQIAASGHSAGGHIAACTCTIKGLEAQGEDLSVSSKPDLLVLFEPAIQCVPNMSLGVGSEMAIKISPYHNLYKEVPPAFLFYGTDDVSLMAVGIDFVEKSKKLGTITELYTAEGQRHWGFQKSPWLERTIYLADKFLARYGYTQSEPTIKLPEGKDEIKKMSGINLYAYAEERWGHTPLHRAARHGQQESAKRLIADGADVNAKDKWGWRPLHCAVFDAHKELAELLIANGADVSVKDKGGFRPLHYANLKDVVEMLIAKGADVNAGANRGRTPLYQAIRRGDKEKAELLIANGADVNAKSYKGESALSWAKRRGRAEIVELLRKHGAKE